MRIVILASFLACCASAASAETSVEPLQPNLSGQSVECGAFRHDADGSWTTLKDMPMQRQNEFTTVSAGTAFRAGGPKTAGMDVGGVLDAVCPH